MVQSRSLSIADAQCLYATYLDVGNSTRSCKRMHFSFEVQAIMRVYNPLNVHICFTYGRKSVLAGRIYQLGSSSSDGRDAMTPNALQAFAILCLDSIDVVVNNSVMVRSARLMLNVCLAVVLPLVCAAACLMVNRARSTLIACQAFAIL